MLKSTVRFSGGLTHDNEMNERVADLFTTALELPLDERAAFLTSACAEDAELRLEVEQLLVDAAAADEYFTGSFGAAAWVGDGVTAGSESAGDWAGPFRLLRQLGEGGFGVVWLAEQLEPIRRKVAVKVIKAGMDSREVLARFAAERQALARMDHPNIARVLDAGLTAAKHPYFAMEWVDGVPINRFCNEQGLDLAARLLLFSEVCAAISHAHQKGVIHRDIKPANVLVALDDGKPLPKVIDFGIAKATEGQLTEDPVLTRADQWLGTPVYMSPEQAGLENLDLDTRSDIYGLGVLLYELLTGVPPFDHKTLILAGHDEMRRIIREVEPQRPSLRLGALPPAELDAIAKSRKVSPSQLRRLVDSEMDWIVVKAIEKTRDRRYDTAAALAADIGRFLRDEPVTAKPPSAFYLFSKFAKRHLTVLLTACGVGLLLVATAVFSSWQALRATKAEALADERLDEAVAERNAKGEALREAVAQRNAKDEALREAQATTRRLTQAEELARQRLSDAIAERNAKDGALQDAQAVSRLLAEVFQRPNPAKDGRTVTVIEALDAATEKLNVELAGQPERHAMLLEVLAGTYERLALNDKALPLLEKALEIRRKHPGIEQAESLEALRRVIETLERLGQYARAHDLAEEEVPLSRRLHGANHEHTLAALRSLANGYFLTGNRAKAIVTQQEYLEGIRAVHGELTRPFTVAQWQLDHFQGKNAGEGNDGLAGEIPRTPVTRTGTEKPGATEESGQPTNARRRKADEALAVSRKAYDAALLNALDAQSKLAEIQSQLKRTDDAVRTQTEILAVAQKEYGPLSQAALRFHQRLVIRCREAGQPNEAMRIQQQLVELLCERDGDGASSAIECEDELLSFMWRSGLLSAY